MHRPSLSRVALLLTGLLVSGGCPNEETGTDTEGSEVGDCAAKLVKGQLVITEIMPDPAGADDNGFEWFEVYNASEVPLSLQGVGLEASKIDGSSPKGHLIKDETLTIEPGAYLVFGKAAQDTKPAHVGYGYGADLGSFGNSDGKVRVVCGDVTIDEVLYEDPKDGYSRSYGGFPPDAAGNDELTAWCLGDEPYASEEYGTPGAQNPECPLQQLECGQCYENDLIRPVKAPMPGQLVITEVMPNAKVTDAVAGEWFELHLTEGEVDLNCLQFGGNSTRFAADPGSPEKVLNAPMCLTMSAGQYVVFGENIEWSEADFESKITLVDSPSDSNPNPGVYVAYDGVILDEVHYGKTTDGAAFSLDPDALSSTANDDPANWCLATTPFDEGDLGSPRAQNPQCPTVAQPGTCIAADGNPRPIDYAAPGELLVTEVFTDPKLGDSALAEWIELRIGADLDLNGITLGKTLDSPYATIASVDCVPIAAGSLVLIARSDDPAVNGGLPAPDWVDKLSLTNDDSTLVVGLDDGVSLQPVELDRVSWNATADGAARQLPIGLVPAAAPFDVTVNDDPTQWCDALTPFGLGDLGTPRADNVGCDDIPPPMDECIDPDTMLSRKIVHPGVGDLLITELHADPDALLKSGGAGEPTGEWFELHAAAAFDLNGLQLGNTFPTVKHTITSAQCLPVAADSEALLAVAGKPAAPPNPMDPAGNGGLPTPDHAYTGISLSNGGGGLFVAFADELLDSVVYPKASIGKAHQLGTGADCLGPAPLDPLCNDDFANWCAGSTPYGLGDAGTPDAANLACGGGNMDPMCFDVDLGAMRPLVTPAPGDLVINEFLADPTVVTDANGEWFEVKVLADVDLNGLKVLPKANVDMATLAAAAPTLVSPDCLAVTTGQVLLFAHQTDPQVNGNLPEVDFKVSGALGNATGGLTLGHADVLLHTVAWLVGQKPGKATALDPDGALDPMNINSDGPPWCTAVDAGTPKQENPQCP